MIISRAFWILGSVTGIIILWRGRGAKFLIEFDRDSKVSWFEKCVFIAIRNIVTILKLLIRSFFFLNGFFIYDIYFHIKRKRKIWRIRYEFSWIFNTWYWWRKSMCIITSKYSTKSSSINRDDQSKQYVMIYDRRAATFLYFSFKLSLVAYSNPINIYMHLNYALFI